MAKTPKVPSIKIVAVGDIHWGAVDPEVLMAELEVLFEWLDENKFDALIQLGDWFHKRLDLDSDSSKMAMAAMVHLCNVTNERGVPFRIIKGTLTHDYRQLDNYLPLELVYPNFQIINQITSEELFKDFNVLWMPEEYPKDYGDYYGPHFYDDEDNPYVYDAIFGHGEINVACSWSDSSESERPIKSSHVHQAAELLDHCSGPIWFGHVHNEFVYKNRLGYPGSFTRWAHGEEWRKGFDILEVSPDLNTKGFHNMRMIKVENELAPLYITRKAYEIFDPADPIDDVVRKIEESASEVKKLRVDLESFPISTEELAILRGSFSANPNIEIRTSKKLILAKIEEEEAESKEEDTPLSYLRDQSISIENRLIKYIGESSPDIARDLTESEVRELTSPL
jgi:DNA repair exonuclease SbcCD nuclease subunit